MTESFDLFERMSQTSVGRSLLERFEAPARAADGVAHQAEWACEDGYRVIYTTSRVQGGPHDGKFVTQLFKPTGKGARTGKATRFVETYRRAFATRKAAKARAETLYRQHSPKYDAANPR